MSIFKRFWKNKTGNFGVMSALLAVPLIGAAGGAVDLSRVMELRARMFAAADATAVTAVSRSSQAYTLASSMTSDGEVRIKPDALQQAFWSNSNGIDPADGKVAVKVDKKGDELRSTVSFSVDVETFFLPLLGVKKITISNSVSAVYGLTGVANTDFYILLDNSPSMGLGATKNDIDSLVMATRNAGKRECAFACHEVWNSGTEVKDSNYKIARANNIKLRIDLLREAVLDVIDHASNFSQSSTRLRFAAYTFGRRAQASGHAIDQISDLTTNMISFRRSVEQVSLMTTQHANYNQDALTSFETSLTEVGKQMVDNNSGSSAINKPEKVLLLITDGVGNSVKPDSCTGFYSGNAARCIEPIDTKICDDLKKQNVKIATLYTTYVPIDDHLYNTYVKKFSARIGAKLKECASPDLYGEAGIHQDLSDALKKLFNKSASAVKVRITS